MLPVASPNVLPQAGTCYRHADRPGLGICVECRKVLCGECTTQFEGINRCSGCLERRLAQSRTLPERADWTFGNVMSAVLAVGLIFAGFYGLALGLGR